MKRPQRWTDALVICLKADRTSGRTFKSLGQEHGISGTRIRQVLANWDRKQRLAEYLKK